MNIYDPDHDDVDDLREDEWPGDEWFDDDDEPEVSEYDEWMDFDPDC